MKTLLILIFFLLGIGISSAEKSPDYFTVSPRDGQGVSDILVQYNLLQHHINVDKFYEINKLSKGDYIIKGKKYILPILIYTYNGKSIRSTIGISDFDHAVRIQEYNIWLHKNKLVSEDYRKSKKLYVPYHEHPDYNANLSLNIKKKPGYIYNDLFGEKYREVKIIDNSLKDKVFYLVSGHGGPDPGAMGKRGGNILCEDEYAYDISLRLARLLMARGATVYNVIEDKNDGIRDEKYLKLDHDEVCMDGSQIPLNQVARLRQRTNLINKYYWMNRKKGFIDQAVVVIHVDSRHKDHRQDVFFLHHEKSKTGKELAHNLRDTFSSKYSKFQKTRSYSGNIQTRNLFLLRETHPPAIYIELANIRNEKDQKRIILKSNRDALAEWIFEGLIKD